MRSTVLTLVVLANVALLGCSGGGGGVVPDESAGPFGRWVAAQRQELAQSRQHGIRLTISLDPATGEVVVTCGDQVLRTVMPVTVAEEPAAETETEPATRTAE